MNWHIIFEYASGFLTIPIIALGLTVFFGGGALLIELVEDHALVTMNYWTGLWAFVGIAVLAATTIARALS